jgi:beta-lactamase class D
LIYNEATKQTKIFGQESFCSKQTAALGSFQIPLALMSFDAGVLPNDQVKLSWDGLKRSHSQWNRDHTAASWMRFSVNWYGQRLAKLLGLQAAGTTHKLNKNLFKLLSKSLRTSTQMPMFYF